MNYLRFDTVKVRRDVEIYQWCETAEGEGEEKTFSYEKKWSNQKINQSSFQDESAKYYAPGNPDEWLLKDETFLNDNLELGQYQITTG